MMKYGGKMKSRTISKTLLSVLILILLINSTIYAVEPLLKSGDKSDSVAMLQQILKDKGYYNYESVTGYYGKITEEWTE